MGTYPIWRKAADRKDHKRLTFVCGAEYVLVEEVISETKDSLSSVDYHSYNLDVDAPEDFYRSLFQYPLTGDPKLIMLRNSDRMTDWEPFNEWMEESYLSMPQTNVLMVSQASSLYLKEGTQYVKGPDGKKVLRNPASSLGSRGRLVECKPLSEEEQVKYAQRLAPELTAELAGYLAGHVGGDIGLLKAAALKLDLFRGSYMDTTTIDQVTEENVGDRFVDLLIRGKKYLAVKAVEKIPMNEYTRIFRQLDYLLDVLTTLNAELRRFITKQEQQQIPGVQPWHAEQYGQLSFSYDRYKVQRCRSALAYCESGMRSGDVVLLEEEDGVLEALVTLWA